MLAARVGLKTSEEVEPVVRHHIVAEQQYGAGVGQEKRHAPAL